MSEAKTNVSIPSGWTLSQQEVSNGIYQVQLTAYFGSIVEMAGTDIDELVVRCVESANNIDKHLGQ